jgi:polyisoprenoid-binding protein YceI
MPRRPLLAAALLACFAGAAVAGPDFAKESPSGKSLVVPEAEQARGAVYYALPGRERMMYFSSDAPVEKIKGQSSTIIGYAIAGKDNPAQLQSGEWHLPVESIRTGNRTRDGHLQGAPWLDAAKNPSIIFQLKEVKDLKPAKEGGKTFSATLVGEMTIHGVTRPLTIADATIAVMPESPETAKVAKGSLMAIRAKYDITLSDYGVKNQVVGQKVADTLQLDNTIYMSTVPPEQQSAPGEGEPKHPERKDAPHDAPQDTPKKGG